MLTAKLPATLGSTRRAATRSPPVRGSGPARWVPRWVPTATDVHGQRPLRDRTCTDVSGRPRTLRTCFASRGSWVRFPSAPLKFQRSRTSATASRAPRGAKQRASATNAERHGRTCRTPKPPFVGTYVPIPSGCPSRLSERYGCPGAGGIASTPQERSCDAFEEVGERRLGIGDATPGVVK